MRSCRESRCGCHDRLPAVCACRTTRRGFSTARSLESRASLVTVRASLVEARTPAAEVRAPSADFRATALKTRAPSRSPHDFFSPPAPRSRFCPFCFWPAGRKGPPPRRPLPVGTAQFTGTSAEARARFAPACRRSRSDRRITRSWEAPTPRESFRWSSLSAAMSLRSLPQAQPHRGTTRAPDFPPTPARSTRWLSRPTNPTSKRIRPAARCGSGSTGPRPCADSSNGSISQMTTAPGWARRLRCRRTPWSATWCSTVCR